MLSHKMVIPSLTPFLPLLCSVYPLPFHEKLFLTLGGELSGPPLFLPAVWPPPIVDMVFILFQRTPEAMQV